MDRYEEAARILVRASELFEDKEEWRNAGGCYEEASHVLEQNLRTLSDERRRYMTTLLVKASLCYGECPNGNQEARGCLQRAINILEEKGLMDDVGFYLVQVGDLYGEQSMWTQAESVYRRAYHVFEDQERVEESEMVTARLAEVVCRGGGDPVEVCDQFVVEHIGMDTGAPPRVILLSVLFSIYGLSDLIKPNNEDEMVTLGAHLMKLTEKLERFSEAFPQFPKTPEFEMCTYAITATLEMDWNRFESSRQVYERCCDPTPSATMTWMLGSIGDCLSV